MKLDELNAAVRDGDIRELIRVAEARQVKRLSRIADDICERRDVRLVLVAGGSAAGKTTTATRLCTQLRVNGRVAVHFSTDDYFVGDELNPRDENGELDYEHVDCVDRKALTSDVAALFDGKSVQVRTFDFPNHAPKMLDYKYTLAAGGIVVMEGIHALNPILTSNLANDLKYRVFVDPVPSLDVFGGIMPSSAESRFLRRMVRDNQFRKLNPEKTVHLWPKVIAGESKWIAPFCGEADAKFDSYLEYELAVLKPFVGGLLERARHSLGDVPMVMNMLRLISAVEPTSPDVVPGDSIIRETIGGSQLEY